jgi:hypothetical protein
MCICSRIDMREHKLVDLRPNPGEKQRRHVPRYPFVASAEIIEPSSGLRVRVLISKLSFRGCYIDVIDPLPPGKELFVKIVTHSDYFEAPATVVYSERHCGTDLAFHSVSTHFRRVLQKWVLSAMRFAAYN